MINLWDVRVPGAAVGLMAPPDEYEAPQLIQPIFTVEGAHTNSTNSTNLSSAQKRNRKRPRLTPLGRGKQQTKASITSLVFLHDGNTLASACAADSVVNLWDTRNMSAPTMMLSLPRADNSMEEGAIRNHGICNLALVRPQYVLRLYWYHLSLPPPFPSLSTPYPLFHVI
jgi:WD40 repeat protein